MAHAPPDTDFDRFREAIRQAVVTLPVAALQCLRAWLQADPVHFMQDPVTTLTALLVTRPASDANRLLAAARAGDLPQPQLAPAVASCPVGSASPPPPKPPAALLARPARWPLGAPKEFRWFDPADQLPTTDLADRLPSLDQWDWPLAPQPSRMSPELVTNMRARLPSGTLDRLDNIMVLSNRLAAVIFVVTSRWLEDSDPADEGDMADFAVARSTIAAVQHHLARVRAEVTAIAVSKLPTEWQHALQPSMPSTAPHFWPDNLVSLSQEIAAQRSVASAIQGKSRRARRRELVAFEAAPANRAGQPTSRQGAGRGKGKGKHQQQPFRGEGAPRGGGAPSE